MALTEGDSRETIAANYFPTPRESLSVRANVYQMTVCGIGRYAQHHLYFADVKIMC